MVTSVFQNLSSQSSVLEKQGRSGKPNPLTRESGRKGMAPVGGFPSMVPQEADQRQNDPDRPVRHKVYMNKWKLVKGPTGKGNCKCGGSCSKCKNKASRSQDSPADLRNHSRAKVNGTSAGSFGRSLKIMDSVSTEDAGAIASVHEKQQRGGGSGPSSGTPTTPTHTNPSTCPTQVVTMGSPLCGRVYGATATYCYPGSTNWWFKERVVMGSPNTCVPGATINQTTTPFQAGATSCIQDLIHNQNGPPSSVAPCSIVTNQTVFAGPTRAQVNMCQYQNVQRIDVTAGPLFGVTTTSAGVSATC